VKTALAIVVALVSPALADGPAAPKVTAPAPVALDQKDRDGLARMLKKVAPRANPQLAYAAMTMAEARQLAGVPAWLKWQVEYDGWFVFSTKSALGGPDEWSGVFYVRKGTNVMGYYRQTW
jgi:hypothetical protein